MASAQSVDVTEDTLSVELSDRRMIAAPISWYPRLSHGTSEERSNWRLIGNGQGIHRSELDEDISVDDLPAGKPSAESQRSLKRWIEKRRGGATA